ncbi:ATP-dependent sacrificial sulfur transferase LarE [Pelagicoccus sp. SDUM812002]|uniref:ATP-dependent sacrificial sulfur transferase LarE n=1 Tax=Pelagicoccus sp. SDUM812002 TaxID=3041266 RepID=UPI0028103866|nr:ATP-dependent sacrificial sulfur transferase LarE [Pelagicoccus sp. SDUM812002]MDQ8187945.1 ATP-dependent sacrificial sulfur transferase LarE [Pelagicoccus sp. SDUM812002]
MKRVNSESKTEDTLLELERWFGKIQGSLTAFSGGVDSALVLFLARRFLGKEGAIGCISDSPSLKRSDLQEAKDFCQKHDIKLEIIHTQEIEDEAYYTNPFNRCFACKSHLYQDLSALLGKHPGFVATNGTNSDDLGDYRPGLQAASKAKVRSPLADCGLDKTAVRKLARHLGLSNWDKPASPCLSSRIPYGQAVTREKLSRIELAETVLTRYGFKQARVRHYPEEARIEVPTRDLEQLKKHLPKITETFAAIGFPNTTLDAEGLVSGKLNRDLPSQK